MEKSNKVVLVTGANGGIGKAIVDKFLSDNAIVIGADILNERSDNSEKYHFIKTDLSNHRSVQQLMKYVIEGYGKVDMLVNAVGVPQEFTKIEDITNENWENIIDVNLRSIFLICREVVPYMKQRNNGVIVNIGSVSVSRPRPGLSAYIASKGGVVSFSEALSLELAPYSIRVIVVNPGPTNTTMLKKFLAPDKKEDLDVFIDSIPLQSLIQPEDLAETVYFVSSERAKMITGDIINVDGGRHL